MCKLFYIIKRSMVVNIGSKSMFDIIHKDDKYISMKYIIAKY